MRKPVPLEVLLRDVRDPHLASLFYAASLLAIDKHSEVNRAYLHYLATRLRLPDAALTRMHGQYGFEASTSGSAHGSGQFGDSVLHDAAVEEHAAGQV